MLCVVVLELHPDFSLIFQKFNMFLKRPTDEPYQVEKVLAKLDSYLRETGNTYLIGERLARADCYLIPTIQHIRVAGKVGEYVVYKTMEYNNCTS